jgi:4-hydroxybenzoate polyprenyltransferase
LIDASIDARNPRTATRAIPAGKISKTSAVIFSIGAFGVMLYAASQLPPLCLQLSPIAVLWLSFYSFTKRFTWMCHLVLGVALGGAAMGGWVAAGGTLDSPAPWLLAVSVATWVAGFDVIYALQDVDFDRAEKLHSIPAAFGIPAALSISSGLHLVTAATLILTGVTLSRGPLFWLGAVIVMAMLKYEHKLVKPDDLSKINAAFFTTNGVVSICMFAATLLDCLFTH